MNLDDIGNSFLLNYLKILKIRKSINSCLGIFDIKILLFKSFYIYAIYIKI